MKKISKFTCYFFNSWSKKQCMYVGIEVALCGLPMEGRPTGPGEGPIKSGSNVPTPRVPSVPRHTDSYSRTTMSFMCQLYSRQLRVTCILIYRGAVSHRARGLKKQGSLLNQDLNVRNGLFSVLFW